MIIEHVVQRDNTTARQVEEPLIRSRSLTEEIHDYKRVKHEKYRLYKKFTSPNLSQLSAGSKHHRLSGVHGVRRRLQQDVDRVMWHLFTRLMLLELKRGEPSFSLSR
jgi:hypothetical protein